MVPANRGRSRTGLPRPMRQRKSASCGRPGYNLFTRAYADSRITYQKPDEPLEKRADSDSDPAVNAFEREVLKSFLQ